MNEKKKRYIELTKLLESPRTVNEYKGLIEMLKEIKDYKDVYLLIIKCENNINDILYDLEEKRKESLYQDALKLIEKTKDNISIQKGINILKTIRDYKKFRRYDFNGS